jgi:hypothetical protein
MASVRPEAPFCKPIPPSPGTIADQLRRVPNMFDSYEAWFEWNHLDLPTMTTDELRADLIACRARIAFEGRSSAWLFERCRAVSALLIGEEGVAA